MRCVNCGKEFGPYDVAVYCAYFDRHDGDTRPPLCRACYARDGGGCWHCELDILISADADPAPADVQEPEPDTRDWGNPVYNPDEDTDGGEDVA